MPHEDLDRFFPLDDSERSYGYSDEIYHGRQGSGGHYRRAYDRDDMTRFYPGQRHHERSYEYAGEGGFPDPYPGTDYGPEEGFVHAVYPPGSQAGRRLPSPRRADWRRAGPYSGRGPRGYRRSDERIREEVCDRLAAHGRVDASDVEVRVEEGEVTLEGSVHDRRAKRLAESVADTVVGVVDVHNRLRLARPGDAAAGAAPS